MKDVAKLDPWERECRELEAEWLASAKKGAIRNRIIFATIVVCAVSSPIAILMAVDYLHKVIHAGLLGIML